MRALLPEGWSWSMRTVENMLNPEPAGCGRTGALQSAVNAHLPVGAMRFPRAPLDARSSGLQSPTSIRSGGTSTLAQQGGPSPAAGL